VAAGACDEIDRIQDELCRGGSAPAEPGPGRRRPVAVEERPQLGFINEQPIELSNAIQELLVYRGLLNCLLRLELVSHGINLFRRENDGNG